MTAPSVQPWLAGRRTELAAEQILDAAAQLFVEHGVAGVGMNDVARAAGCSRATLYRYFENRRALHLAFVNREALRLGRQVADLTADIVDPHERLVEAILQTVAAVRSAPTLAGWFGLGDAGLASELAQSSAVIDGIGAAFLTDLGAASGDLAGRSRWVVRVILSLLTIPDPDERLLVERFVAPVLLGSREGHHA